jgi:hypothetical protein
MKITSLVFLLLAVVLSSPYLQLRVVEARRARAARHLGSERGTQVVTLIHRHEVVALLGLPLYRYVTVPLPTEVADRLRRIDGDRPVDLVAHLPGGLAWDTAPLRAAIAARSGAVTLIVPACALSGGLELAKEVSSIVMGDNAVVGDSEAAALDAAALQEDGLKASSQMPRGVWSLLDRFAQPPRRRPSTLFLPLSADGRRAAPARQGDDGSRPFSAHKLT